MKEKPTDIKKKFSGRRILRLSVNSFLYFIISILIILLITFGFTQTSVFREWLRETIVEELSSAMNGELSIEKLEGTIFTSVILKNTLLTQEQDTVLSAEYIEVKTSPLKLLFKIIYLRKIEIRNTQINLREDQQGILNVAKLFPPSPEEEVPDEESEFSFSFQVADLQLNNIDFTLQEYDLLNSSREYEYMNASDLRINELHLKLSAFADIKLNTYQLGITEFSFNPNFTFFNLQSFTGDFFATQNGILISDLNIRTDQSELTLNAGITDINFFTEFTNEQLGNAPLKVQLEAKKFGISDLATFINGLNTIKGDPVISLNAGGSLNNLSIDRLDLSVYNTNLKLRGYLANTLESDDLLISANLNGSVIDPADPAKLFPASEIPDYSEIGLVTFDSLTFSGSPTDFKTNLLFRMDKSGVVKGSSNLNFKQDDAIYDINLETRNLDLQPFIGLRTNLNSRIIINGTSFDPVKMETEVSIKTSRSKFSESVIDELDFNTTIRRNRLISELKLVLDTATTFDLNGSMNLNNPDDPEYDLTAIAKNLNLGRITGSEDLESLFNFDLQAEGIGFNPDSLDLFLVMNLKNSFIYDFEIDSTALIVDVRRNDNGNKIINIISDLADLTISGQYSIHTLADVIAAETEVIGKSLNEKFSFLLEEVESSDIEDSGESKILSGIDEVSLEYLIDFKEFLTIKFNESEIEIDGSINGNMFATPDSIAFNSTLDLNYFRYWNNADLYFLTQTRLDATLSNKVENGLIDQFSAYVFFRSNRIYAGSNFYDLGVKTEFSNDELTINFKTKIEDHLDIWVDAALDINDELQMLAARIDSLNINYNELRIYNPEPVVVNYNNASFNFEKFKILLAGGSINVSGDFGFEGDGNINLSAEQLEWREIGREILGIPDDVNFDSNIKIEGKVNGNISDVRMNLNLDMTDLVYDSKNIGSLTSELNYSNNNLLLDVKFIDSVRTIESPKLIIDGSFPLKLTAGEDTQTPPQQMNLKLTSENFDLASLGNAVPYVDNIKGNFNSVINITGTPESPVLNGNIDIENTSFKAEMNNLTYNFQTNIELNTDVISIKNISLGNTIGTKYGGTINGSGEFYLDNMKLVKAEMKVNGDLKLLDRISRETSPVVYGDLAVQTDGDITMTMNNGSAFIDIPVNVTVADLNVQLTQTAYQNTSGFIYRYPVYKTEGDEFDTGLDSLILIAEQSKQEKSEESEIQNYFDYRVKVNMKTEAKMIVVLSKELNQSLTAVMDGNFELASREDRTVSSGQLNLLEGSKLSFIKSFDVTGNVRIEKIDNPILNITATYRDYYYPVDTIGVSEEIEVAVKIKFNGQLSDLAKNFIKDEENIAVYVGSENIENDERDPTKSTSDAFLFMIAGKFTDGATNQELNAAASTAASLAGSVLGGVLNRYLGDYVRSVQLRQVGSETKFNLMGRAGKFRYDIGGSTDVFQDLSRANVKIEYPIIPRLLIRLERKEAINESTLSNEIFSELGLKYRFDF